MALDVYVGSLTRYYAGNWETVVQRRGREQGVNVRVVRTNEPADRLQSQDAIAARVHDWRAGLTQSLGDHLKAPLDWEESPDAPYFTDRPAWDGYAALVLLAAYDDHPELTKPVTAPSEWQNDPAWQASAAPGAATRYPQLLQPELWLPCSLGFAFDAADPGGTKVCIGSGPDLADNLRTLNGRTFNDDPPARSAILGAGTPAPGGPFDATARFGLAMFLELVEQATAHRLPMKLDY
jgi:hypothetical protein